MKDWTHKVPTTAGASTDPTRKNDEQNLRVGIVIVATLALHAVSAGTMADLVEPDDAAAARSNTGPWDKVLKSSKPAQTITKQFMDMCFALTI